MSGSNVFSQLCGVIGGLGPEATNYLYSLIITHTPATKDQEHIPLLMFSNPQVPDRTQSLLYNDISPLPELIHTGEVLKKAGATFLVMPCNTAHAYIDEVQKAVGLPILNMIALTATYIAEHYGTQATVGLLATDGTLKTQIYQKQFELIAPNSTLLLPDPSQQKEVMEAIYGDKGIKAGFADAPENFTRLETVALALVKQGAQVIIEGCTEIPLVFAKHTSKAILIDPMEILAKEIIQRTSESRILTQQN